MKVVSRSLLFRGCQYPWLQQLDEHVDAYAFQKITTSLSLACGVSTLLAVERGHGSREEGDGDGKETHFGLLWE